jgi:hypothetical protein
VNYQGHDNTIEPLPPEKQVEQVFSEAGWLVAPAEHADLVVRRGKFVYIVEVKRASEGRADRIIPNISQSVLQVRLYAQKLPKASPLVVLVTQSIRPRVIDQIKAFMRTYAPDVALGLLDSRGLREFSGPGLEKLNRVPSQAKYRFVPLAPVHLFSDLGQWLLKVLLSADVADERLLNAPVRRYRNASDLARGAQVSVMTAFRFIEELKSNGYLHESSDFIRLVRIEELLELWRAAAARPRVSVGARWLFPGEKLSQLRHLSHSLGDQACVASYSAADALGFGIARGVAIQFYVRRLPGDIDRSALVLAEGLEAQVFLRVPSVKESVFRGSVMSEGLRSCDVLQAWLDVSHDASRGGEQAEHLYRQVIRPMLKRANQ